MPGVEIRRGSDPGTSWGSFIPRVASKKKVIWLRTEDIRTRMADVSHLPQLEDHRAASLKGLFSRSQGKGADGTTGLTAYLENDPEQDKAGNYPQMAHLC